MGRAPQRSSGKQEQSWDQKAFIEANARATSPDHAAEQGRQSGVEVVRESSRLVAKPRGRDGANGQWIDSEGRAGGVATEPEPWLQIENGPGNAGWRA